MLVAEIILVLAAAGTAWLLTRTGVSGEIPTVDTSEMLPPVARAVEAGREAVTDDPDSADAWGRFAQVLDAHQLYDAAIICYRHALELAPKDFRWSYLLAVALDFGSADPESVRAAFEHALVLGPRFPPGYVRYGDALVRVGRLEEARAAYAQAAELAPELALAARGLGQTLLSLDRTAEAIAALERASELLPEDQITFASLADAYTRNGDHARADACRERAAALRPERSLPDPYRYEVDLLTMTPSACDRRARERAAAGDLAGELVELERLAEMVPDEPSIQARLGRCELANGHAEDAERAFEAALALDEEEVRAHQGLADLMEARGELAAAERHVRVIAELAPLHAEWRMRLALLRAKQGDLEGAVEEFERTAALGMSTAELHHNWGTALDRLGRRREACAHFRAALSIEGDNPDTLFNLGLSLEALGEEDEALDCYRRAVAARPTHAAAERLAALETDPR